MSESQPVKENTQELTAYLSPLGAWALSIGCSIGWGSFVITCNTYLSQAGPAGSILGMLVALAVMIVIARSYHYMMNRFPDSGGVYSYAKNILGFDHGVLVAWFLGLTYLAVLWANATSLPLFARYFIGDVFKFGYLYQLFGYDVYFGEVLLSIAAIVLIGLLCSYSRRVTSALMVGMAFVFVVAILVCFGAAMINHDGAVFSFDPAFIPDSAALSQVVLIATISPWAFIGFESISHSTAEFAFPRSRSFAILVGSLIVTTLLYVAVILLSISAFPQQYANWFEYIADLGNLSGIEGLPAFYAANYYLGSFGVSALVFALLALIVTSLIANIIAISRLVYALAKDEVLPVQFGSLNSNGIPAKAIWTIVGISMLLALIGRTAIGWIVDVTTIGAIIVYGFVSLVAFKAAQKDNRTVETACGLIGLVVMVISGVVFFAPSLIAQGTMAPESYFLFTVWAILGFAVFHRILVKDEHRRFGRSTIVWIALFALILLTSLAWVAQATRAATYDTMGEVKTYYESQTGQTVPQQDEEAFLNESAEGMHSSHMLTLVVVYGLIACSFGIMMSNYTIMRRREREQEHELFTARMAANTDSLTGVKSKHAYVDLETSMNLRIEEGTSQDFCIAVCDVNGLKLINDTQGHKAGDEYIRSACMLICEHFKHSPVFRIGGDEFVSILVGQDYINRTQLVEALDKRCVENAVNGGVVIAVGASDYNRKTDSAVSQVFERADALMYKRKKELKGEA